MEMESKSIDNHPETVSANQQPLSPPVQSNRKSIIVLLVIIGFLVFGIGGYLIGSTVNRVSPNSNNFDQYNTQTPTTVTQSPQPTNNVNALGQTTFSYLENQNDTYIKATIDLNDPVVEYPNSQLR